MLGTKPLASLSSGLLARKGQAKPAMRSQGYAGFAPQLATPSQLEDLGWNDMGVAAVHVAEPPREPVAPPPVVALRESLKREIETQDAEEPAESEPMAADPVEIRPVSIATARRISRESAEQTGKGGKAAFTLRLDAPRHLRLRLASALSGRSSQQLVTQAVDDFLNSMPEVDALMAQLPEPKRRR